MSDPGTLEFYRRNAESYAAWAKGPSARLIGFLGLLPEGGSILELGCGAGSHAAEMLARGFMLRATDGSPEMAEIASRRLNHPVATMRFDELTESDAFDGVWASACLLHVPKEDLAGILTRIHRALKTGGVFYASYKAGGRWPGLARPILQLCLGGLASRDLCRSRDVANHRLRDKRDQELRRNAGHPVAFCHA